MKLLDEIVEMAADGKKPVSDALRKCLILAFQLENETMKEWVEHELNGYEQNDTIPDYRKVVLFSRGNFTGPGGAWLPSRALPISIIVKDHRKWLVSALQAPIGSYEGYDLKKGELIINWPPDLIVQYQAKFIDGYALSQAWQEVPQSMVVGMCEQVRNRLLRFALELRAELGTEEASPENIAPQKIEAAIVNHIYGGVNMIGGTVNTNINNIAIPPGDFSALKDAFEKARLPHDEMLALQNALEEDKREGEKSGIGRKTAHWLASVGGKVGKAGLQVGQEVATQWLMQYLGLKP